MGKYHIIVVISKGPFSLISDIKIAPRPNLAVLVKRLGAEQRSEKAFIRRCNHNGIQYVVGTRGRSPWSWTMEVVFGDDCHKWTLLKVVIRGDRQNILLE